MSPYFLAYARADKNLAAQIVQVCESASLQIWWDRKLLVGVFFRAVVNRRIEAASAVIALWSTRSAVSPWVISEADHGHSLMKLVNICVPGFSPDQIPKPFSAYNSLQWSDLNSLPDVLRAGYFGTFAEPDELRSNSADKRGDIPFLAILDELYFHHASVVRRDATTLQTYLQRFPNGKFVAQAARQLSALTENNQTEPNLKAWADELTDSNNRVIELLQGVRSDGQPFWAYVAVLPSVYPAYVSEKATGGIDLHDFAQWGEVVSAGIGHWPRNSDHQYVADRFQIDPSTLFAGEAVAVAIELGQRKSGTTAEDEA